jgi:hypothetical protein
MSRPSAYPTIDAACEAAVPMARERKRRICVITDQPHDGGFTFSDPLACEPSAVYINVDQNGEPRDGPAAMLLPINFTGALPVGKA